MTEPGAGWHIRAMSWVAFRAREWAVIRGTAALPIEGEDRPCYLVEFPDGATDFLPIGDSDVLYEFREPEAGYAAPGRQPPPQAGRSEPLADWKVRALELSLPAGGVSIWSKHVLPLGEVRQPHVTFQFTPDHIAQAAESFAQHALDIVPFQISATDNLLYRAGVVIGAEVMDDGLDVIIAVDRFWHSLLTANPPGVSVRLSQGYRSDDGRVFPVALVLVAAVPHSPFSSLRPWTLISPFWHPGT